MDDGELFTPETRTEFLRRTAEATGPGQQLLAQYREDREAQIDQAPDLQTWIDALEDCDLVAATDAGLWLRMAAQGFIEVPTPRTPYPDRGVFVVRIISPRVFDAFRSGDGPGPRSDYAFTTVRICLRRDPVPDRLAVPPGWSNPALVDTELFEEPPDVTEDMFDDLEKIHVIYLAATEDGRFVCRPVYIGVGTGEAYGTGPRRRTTRGRFRLYRYDAKDNFQLEFIRSSVGRDEEKDNVRTLPPIPLIGETRATLLLAKSAVDRGFMSLSDPEVARWHTVWLRDHRENRIVYREITLEKVHDDLRAGEATTPFAADDVAAALAHAWNIQRWYYIAWQHPQRLGEAEGIDLYYDLLPAFRREEYEIYRFQPSIFGLSSDDPAAAALTVPRILRSPDLRRQLEAARPGAVARLDRWLQQQVMRDLYAYGNHPEFRLCTAIALWHRLAATGQWDAAVELAYRNRLFEVELGFNCMCVASQADRETS
ncbi:MAG: hypothetical protein U0835_24105 [Isosphaeraceae bacterium]